MRKELKRLSWINAPVAKSADALCLGRSLARGEGSSPSGRTTGKLATRLMDAKELNE